MLARAALTFFGNTSGTIAAILAGIVTARVLGPAGKGIIAYAALVLTIFVTYANGVQQAILHQRGHLREDARAVYAAALRIGLAACVVVGLGCALTALLVPKLGAVAYAGAALPFAIYTQIAIGFFFLADDIAATVIVGAFTTVGYAALTVAAILLHGGVDAVLGVWVATYVLSALWAQQRLTRYLPRVAWRTSAKLVRDQARFALKVGSVNLADFLNLRVDVLIVGAMLGARELGLYSLAVATGEMMWQLSRPLAWTAIGRIATLERAAAAALAARVTRTILCAEAIAGIVLFAIAPAAVRFVYGPAFDPSSELVRWLLPGLVLYAAHGTIGAFITLKEGRPLVILAVQGTAVVACALLTVATIGRYGLLGAALATVVTYAFSALAKAVLFVRATGLPPAALLVADRADVARVRELTAGALRRLTPGAAPLARPNADASSHAESTS